HQTTSRTRAYSSDNETATTEIYTLSLHDALPISDASGESARSVARQDLAHVARSTLPAHAARHSERAQPHSEGRRAGFRRSPQRDRKSTRLNSSHLVISYAVFCLKKKKKED